MKPDTVKAKKICGNCSFANTATKKYCDRCGTSLTAPPPSAAAGAQDMAAPGSGLLAARRLDPSQPAPVIRQDAYIPPPPPTAASLTRLRRRYARQNFLIWGPLVALLTAAGFLYYDYHLPQNELPRLAARYLDALNRQDPAAAYALLSPEAKNHCTFEEFKAGRETSGWTWSDLKLTRLEPEAAVLKYRLTVAGQAPRDDALMFVRADGGWTRPYDWNLLQRAESALDHNDPDMALLMAQEAVRINPRDPMARGYLCEASYYRKMASQTERECAAALKLSETYPSQLSLKSLYHLRAILGDTYKNALGKYPEALAQYEVLLAFPGLAPTDRCDLLLARADTRQAMGDAAAAGADLQSAAAVCVKPTDLEFIRKHQARPPAER